MAEPTIKEIAKLAGVSVGTVSNVINHKRNVDPTLRARVESAIEHAGYRPNVHARGMILKRSFNVGIVIPSLTDPFFPKFAEAIEIFVEERDSNVVIGSSRHEPSRERWLCESLLSKQIDGIIITPCARENIGFFNELAEAGVSIVQLGRYFDDVRTPIVHATNRETAAEAVSLLVDNGHRRIVHVAGDSDSSPDSERKRGFLEAATRIGIEDQVTVISGMHDGSYDGTRALLELLEKDDSISGVFADNDSIAMGCLKACEKVGLRVPEDLSLVSVGGFYYNEMLPKPITTFAIDYATMSRLAVDFLYADVRGREEAQQETNPAPPTSASRSVKTGEGSPATPVESVPMQLVPGATLGRYLKH